MHAHKLVIYAAASVGKQFPAYIHAKPDLPQKTHAVVLAPFKSVT